MTIQIRVCITKSFGKKLKKCEKNLVVCTSIKKEDGQILKTHLNKTSNSMTVKLFAVQYVWKSWKTHCYCLTVIY